ncbi:SDR family oxidoreductase [Roseomonas sp. M0104]|uniref:SDR family oxidoreductase n=1 Tax=Teichococcus coralli TaxID=2545983 RepID=A0A845BAQ0_9PROT|nr:SDR family oxidoreductase [Pseudoroseomonas coralli]MXP63164.1 SDR family oxidoreductase [Pseudoroseomonas coralli]
MAERVVVLGATGGVGKALSRRLIARGAEPFLIARDADRLAALAREIEAPFAPADATDPDALAAAIGRAGPRLAGLAYCIGSIPLRPLKRLTAADFAEAFRLNATGAALAVQAAQPALAAADGGGSVVLFSSIAARAGFPSHALIAAAKAAVEGLVVALGAELAPAIRVNAVAPSLMRTRMAAAMTESAQMAEAIARLHPLPRLGEPEDAAALADFLLSPQAGWISGQVVGVDGGRGTLRVKG